ncbi:MAG: ferritin-like domain-containing protein [bacterium]
MWRRGGVVAGGPRRRGGRDPDGDDPEAGLAGHDGRRLGAAAAGEGSAGAPRAEGGADWTAGARPDPAGLDGLTRSALEALWLHDAQKEHASVPAFSRISWLLAAVGAPAELLIGAHRAALEEIDHAQRCFALAAGYGGRSHTVETMPELLVGAMDLAGDPRVLLAVESLKDGCLLEDFNADMAGACAAVCQEPATRDVLERIAREERSHAEFSWEVLAWTLAQGGKRVRAAVAAAAAELALVARPTAVSAEKALLVAAADQAALRAHGRLGDAEWAACWEARLASTRARVGALLGEAPARRAA